MVAFNVSVDDSSPLISYSPFNAWLDSSANDTASKLYSQSSLHSSFVTGATAELTFNGTGVWLYGGFRSNYGSYVVSVDGVQVLRADASATDLELRRLLAGVSGLEMGQHKVTLTNGGTGLVDLDYMVFETSVGTKGTLTNTTIDDTDSKIKYSPSALDWERDSNSIFYNNSLHYSQSDGAQASFSFSGDAIAVYGTVSPLHANFTATLDGENSLQVNASNARILHTQTLLYFAQSLDSKEHSLVITGNPGHGTGRYVDIDFLTVYSTSGDLNAASMSGTASTSSSNISIISNSVSSTGPTSTPSSSPTNPSLNSATNNDRMDTNNERSSRLSKGAVAGITIGSLLGFLVLLLLLLYFLRRRQEPSQLGSGPDGPRKLSLASPALPMQDPDLEAAYEYEIQEKDLHAADRDTDVVDKRMSNASTVSHWSQDSSITLQHNEPPLPKWEMSGPVPTFTLAVRNSTHAHRMSDTSTVVNEEIAEGLSEVVLSPPSYLPNARRNAPPRPPRPASLLMSVPQYYFEA